MTIPLPADLYSNWYRSQSAALCDEPDGTHHVICQGESRLRIIEFLDGYPFFVARVERLPEVEETRPEIDARLLYLRNQALEVLQLLPQTPASWSTRCRTSRRRLAWQI